jgi:hypothetical protein
MRNITGVIQDVKSQIEPGHTVVVKWMLKLRMPYKP